MKLSRGEWERRFDAGTLKMALVGMSNIGKSSSGMRFATRFNFSLIEVDRLIWERLGERDMEAFAQWLGQPYTDGYAEREAKSMLLETDATEEAMRTSARNPLLDTTGSVIYTGDDVLHRLATDWYTVYIEADPEQVWQLKKLYFEAPKPLAWQGHFAMQPGLTQTESLIACYSGLLESRAKAYARIADRTVSSRDILVKDTARLLDLFKPPV